MYALHYNFHNISKSCKEGLYCLELDEVGGFGRSFVMDKGSVERLFEKLKELLDEIDATYVEDILSIVKETDDE